MVPSTDLNISISLDTARFSQDIFAPPLYLGLLDADSWDESPPDTPPPLTPIFVIRVSLFATHQEQECAPATTLHSSLMQLDEPVLPLGSPIMWNEDLTTASSLELPGKLVNTAPSTPDLEAMDSRLFLGLLGVDGKFANLSFVSNVSLLL